MIKSCWEGFLPRLFSDAAEQQNPNILDQNTMNSSEMAAEGAEDNNMEVNCSSGEKDHKAASQQEGPNLETETTSEAAEDNKMEVSSPADENKDEAGSLTLVSNLGATENTSPEKTSKATEKNKMEVSRSPKEKKNEAEKQPKSSNQWGIPPQVNQGENTPHDNRTPMDTSESKNTKTKQKPKSGKETKGLKAEGTKKSLMKCPKCQAGIFPSVTFCKQTNDQCEFNIVLQQDSGDDHTALFTNRIPFGEPAGNLNKNCCLHCKQSIIYESFAKRNNKMGGFDIELSINISKDKPEGETVGGTQSQHRNCVDKGIEQDDKGMEQDDKGMEQDDGDDSSSEKSTDSRYIGAEENSPYEDAAALNAAVPGCKTDNSSKRRGNTVPSKSAESRNSSSRKPEQSNQTTDSKGWSFPNIFKSPTPVVRVHCTPTSDTFGTDTAIMKQLEDNLKSSVQLEETTRENCSIIIVFCPVSCSFESEIKSAMEKEAVSSSGKPFILVLMHHTRDPDYSTAGCDTSEVLKNVLYVHVFYHETEQGLLRCRQNTMAIKDIEKKLKTHKQ